METFASALRFGGFALAHAAYCVSDLKGGDLLIPFAVLEQDGKQSIERFYAETQEEAIANGKASLDGFRNLLDYWAFVREGLRSVNGSDQKTDVLVVSTWAQGLEQPVILMQDYSPNTNGRFLLLGKTTVIVNDTIFAEEYQEEMRPVILEGVAAHAQGKNWKKWTAK